MTELLSFFLKTGTTFAFFHSDGKIPDLMEVLAKMLIGFTKLSARVLRILLPIPSMPHALFTLRDFRIFKTFSFVTSIELSSGLDSSMTSLVSSNAIGVCCDCDAKNSFNRLALLMSSVYVMPFTPAGRERGIRPAAHRRSRRRYAGARRSSVVLNDLSP